MADAPEQPTPEALMQALEDYGANKDDWDALFEHEKLRIIKRALQYDRFAVQRIAEAVSRCVRVVDIIAAFEGSAMNTDTDPRWVAANALRNLQDWQNRTIDMRVSSTSFAARDFMELADKALMRSMPIIHKGELAIPPSGDAGERAREIITMAVNVAANVAPDMLLLHWRVDRELVKGIAAALQSERTAAEDAQADADNTRAYLASVKESMRQLREAIGIERGNDHWPEFMGRVRAKLASDRTAAASEARNVALLDAMGCCTPEATEAWSREAIRAGELIWQRIHNLGMPEVTKALVTANFAGRAQAIAELRDPNGEIYQRSLKLGVLATLHDIADWLASTPAALPREDWNGSEEK